MDQQQVDTQKLKEIIESSNRDSLIVYAQAIGGRAARADLGTSQVRNIYGMVKQMQTQAEPDYGRLKLLVPKLYYVAARQPALKELAAVLTAAVTMVDTNQERFRNFADFFEAIVAYHYAAYTDRKGGR
jgi:CRISPR-associated protein Csm2